jgi:hypothetical protein
MSKSSPGVILRQFRGDSLDFADTTDCGATFCPRENHSFKSSILALYAICFAVRSPTSAHFCRLIPHRVWLLALQFSALSMHFLSGALCFCLVLSVLYSFSKKNRCFFHKFQELSNFCRRPSTEKCRRCTGRRRPSTELRRRNTVWSLSDFETPTKKMSSAMYGIALRFLSSAKYGTLRQKWQRVCVG